jgi:hypothetical protein
MVDAVKRRAGIEGLRVIGANVAQFPIGGNDRGFATANGRGGLSYHSTLLTG